MPVEIEFCLLGPLVVRRAGTVVPVSRGKQRAVLAVLLLNANQIVSVDELTEMLWGPDPPASARVTVQNYVKRLRHVLGDAERARTRTAGTRERLVTRHPGYLLQAAEDEVDVARFRRLCRDGGTALHEGAWDRADGLLGEALGLWRGAPLADVPSDLLVRDEVPGLEELRLQAEEWRADAGLHLGRHDELVPALRALAARHPLRERFHAQLMLALYRCGRQAEALAAYSRARHALIDELGAEPGPDLQDLQRQVLAADPALAVAGASRLAGAAVPVFPYRGLSAFGEQDAGLFFGREDATARVLERMSGCLDGAGLVVVSGVSGAGKSSLLRAGVLPGLGMAGLAAAPEAASWPCLAFTPGRSPVAELAVRVAPLTGVDAAALRQQLTADPAGFALTARQAALSGGKQRRVVLVVDQCEQLFTACESAREREAFVTALHAAASGDSSGQPPAALVVLVVRADFEARLADVPQLAAAVQNRYLLTAMTRRQLRLAITGPAAAAGCGVEEDLVQVLLEETGARTAGQPARGAAAGAGVLPLLSHVLDQAWRARAGRQLTLADYERAGGIDGAVAASAQRAYQALTPAQQQAARRIFTQLAVPGPDGTDTALPAVRADLTAGNSAAQTADVEVVLERFAVERLLTLDAGTVAISHEVLLTAWPLLREDWLAEARGDRIVRARLHATATEWAQDSRDPSYLYGGSRLEAAAATAARIAADPRQLPLGHADTDFLHASRRAGRRRVRARRQLTVVLLALLAALTTVTVLAVRAGQAATAQRDISVSRQLISQSQGLAGTNATASQIQAIAAWALNPSPQARDAMLTAAANPQTSTIAADPGGVFSVAYSPDGKTLATGGSSGVRFWELATGQQTGRTLAAGESISSVAYSPNGKTLATSGPSGVQLWDVATGRPTGFSSESTSAAFSPDGKTLATSSRTSGVQLWDASADRQTGNVLDGGHSISSAAFSPDGKTLATSGSSGVQLWDVATGQQITAPLTSGDGVPITSIAFSPVGKTLATTTGDGTARLWNLATGRQIGKPFAGVGLMALGPYHVACGSVAFSPDGKTLATCGSDTPRLWDVATGQQVTVPSAGGDGYPVTSVAFSQDGKTLATGSQDGTARLWNVAALTFRRLGSPPADGSSQITAMAFSPDGQTLAAGGADGTAQLWDLATGRRTGKAFYTGSQITAVAFSQDGGRLATASWPGVRLWDTATGALAGTPVVGVDSTIDAIALSSDGKALTILTAGGTTQRWDVATGRLAGDYPGPDAYCGACVMAFSPDGKTLGFVGNVSNSGVMLWNMATNRPTGQPLSGTVRLAVDAMAFSPDGQTLATGGPSGAQLWDLATGQQIAGPLTGSPVNAVAFSPDGKTLATAGPDGTMLWAVAPVTNALTHICAQAGGSLTPATWARYVPAGTPYLNPCPPTRAR